MCSAKRSRNARGLSAVLVVALILVAGWFLARPESSMNRNSSAPIRRLPKSMSWRITGLSVRGEADATPWSARATTAYSIGTRVGPFRLQALKELVLENLEFELTPRPDGDQTANSLKSGVEKLAESVSTQAQASRVAIQGLHVDIRDQQGLLRCCLRAGRARWRRDQGGDIELSDIVEISTVSETAHADRAVLGTKSPELLAEQWQSAAGGGIRDHSSGTSLEACPLQTVGTRR